MADIEITRAQALEDIPHGFLGRVGGVSRGVVSGLNVGLGADDDTADVMENRRLAAQAVLPDATLVTPYQVHSPKAVIIDAPWELADRPHADALVTDKPGLLLGIVTADCAPVLLADRDAGVVAAAHAGWRGAFDGVIAETVQAMVQLGAKPSKIAASVGPCIAQSSYEVDAGFRERFGVGHAHLFAPGKPGHYQFDLESFVAEQLQAAGVGTIEALSVDTYTNPDRFYSYRRATHQKEATYGRQFSLISLSA